MSSLTQRLWEHYGYDNQGGWGRLPATLKLKQTPPSGRSWVLVYPDGYEVDTHHDYTCRKTQMVAMVERAGITLV